MKLSGFLCIIRAILTSYTITTNSVLGFVQDYGNPEAKNFRKVSRSRIWAGCEGNDNKYDGDDHMLQYDFRRRALVEGFIGTSIFASLSCPGTMPALASYIDPVLNPPNITRRVYLDVEIGDSGKSGRLVIGLFGELMPQVSDNFERLCAKNAYAGTTFYRVLSGFSVQGGAIGDGGKGLSGVSATGTPFAPDNYKLMHTKAGLISMVRTDSSGYVDSRFYITCKDDAQWGDDRYAAFGIVEETEGGGMNFIRAIENVRVEKPNNNPKKAVRIVGSGLIS